MKFIYIFLFVPLLSLAQAQVAKGVVLDANTQKTIPYVNISVVNSKAGTSSNREGNYALIIYSEDLDKIMKISSLGYQNREIEVSEFLKLTQIHLQSSIEALDEIVITKKRDDKWVEVNPLHKGQIYGGFGAGTRPWNIGLYFPYKSNYKQTPWLKSLVVHINENVFKNQRESKFRIRVYAVDNNGLPGKDLIYQNIIITVSKDQDFVLVDLSRHNLKIPTNGLYVALEGLAIPFNAYTSKSNVTNAEGQNELRDITRYAPSFAATSAYVRDHKVVFYVDGKWWDYDVNTPANQKMFIPAIMLSLSN